MTNRIPHSSHFGEHFGDHFGLHFGGIPFPNYDDDPVQTAGAGRTGVDQPYFDGVKYPFLRPNRAAEWVEDLHVSMSLPESPEMQMRWIGGIGMMPCEPGVPILVHDVDMQLRSADGSVIVDTRPMEFQSRHWAGDVYVYTWTSEDVVVQATIRRGDSAAKGYFLIDEPIDPRAISVRPRSVTAVSVRTSSGYASAVRSDKTFKFASGYNVALPSGTMTSERGERLSKVTFNAEPGAGLGKFPGCDWDLGVTSLGKSTPSVEGGLLVSGDECITIRPALSWELAGVSVVDGQFKAQDNCSAACECSDFVSVAQYAIGTWNKYRVLAARVSSLRGAYHDLREEILDWQQCAESHPLRAYAFRADPCGLGLGVGICNVSKSCVTGASLDVRILDGDSNDVLGTMDTSNAYRVAYTDGLGYVVPTEFSYDSETGKYTIDLADIEPGQMGFAFLRFELSSCDQAGDIETSINGLPEDWQSVAPITKPFDFSDRV